MVLEFKVVNQALRRIDSKAVVADSQNYLTATFAFSSDWNDLQKVATFYSEKSEAYSVVLDASNSCVVPWEILDADNIARDVIYVSVVGIGDDLRITTNPIEILVTRSGYNDSTQESLEPTPSVYEDLTRRVTALEEGGGGSGGGTPGKDGKDGADGKSAYEVAVENGFVGTESEWLESLKGENEINDSTVSNISTYSSAKIEQLLEDVIDDFNASILGGEG